MAGQFIASVSIACVTSPAGNSCCRGKNGFLYHHPLTAEMLYTVRNYRRLRHNLMINCMIVKKVQVGALGCSLTYEIYANEFHTNFNCKELNTKYNKLLILYTYNVMMYIFLCTNNISVATGGGATRDNCPPNSHKVDP